jgi:hypothetical protein
MLIINGKNKYVNFTNKTGEFHRDDRPAIIEEDREEWYQNGKLHRLDGPALFFEDGFEEYYIEDNFYHDYTKYLNEVEKYHNNLKDTY